MRKLLLSLIAVSALNTPAHADEGVVFNVEPERGLTFSHTGELRAGSEVLLEIHHLPENQRFVANRCGEQCTTSEVVFEVVGRALDRMTRSFGIEKTGRYYFFVQRRDESGATGPVGLLRVEPEDDGFLATFAGGAMVRGRVRGTREPAPTADPEPSTEDSVEILAISPQPLTRGVPVEVTVDVRVFLDSAFEGKVGLAFNREQPGQFAWVDSRTVSAGSQFLTFVLDVVPIDWGERGDFAVSVYLLPGTDFSGRITPLATDRETIEVVP